MKTNGAYTNLAKAYNDRADYSLELIEKIYKTASLTKNSKLCDIGAGVGHLTKLFSKKVHSVYAIEPNNEMRKYGKINLKNDKNVKWFEAVAEETGMEDSFFDMVSFGSSFNVCDKKNTLNEVNRILKPNSWFCCLWNHRNLDDDIQSKIEEIIKNNIENYNYGSRRENQSTIIEKSNLFKNITYLEGDTTHLLPIEKFIEAWNSHATIQRQSRENFSKITEQIKKFLLNLQKKTIKVPYKTVAWIAQKK